MVRGCVGPGQAVQARQTVLAGSRTGTWAGGEKGTLKLPPQGDQLEHEINLK